MGGVVVSRIDPRPQQGPAAASGSAGKGSGCDPCRAEQNGEETNRTGPKGQRSVFSACSVQRACRSIIIYRLPHRPILSDVLFPSAVVAAETDASFKGGRFPVPSPLLLTRCGTWQAHRCRRKLTTITWRISAGEVFDQCSFRCFDAYRTNQNICIELLIHSIRASALDGEVLS